jgi:polysaccharide pyruvyl transferase WcaK-like protein
VQAVKELLPAEIKYKVVFQPCTTTIIRKISPWLENKRYNNSVCFNVAFDREDKRYGSSKELILKQIAKSVCDIQSRGYDVYYIAHCKSDLLFVDYLPKGVVKIVDADGWNYKKLISFYNKIDCVIGMRGHAQMIPFGVNCEIITLGSHDKMKWFLQDINALDWYIEISQDSEKLSRTIVNKFVDIHEKHGQITRKRLKVEQDKLWEITCNNFKAIAEIIGG